MAEYFKDPEYLNSLQNYDSCVYAYFNEVKDNHKELDRIVKTKDFRICTKEYQIIKEKIEAGLLEYDNFAK